MCEHSNHVESLSDELISRILPSNACFMRASSVGIERLRRLLRVMKWLQRSGSNPVASSETVNVAVIAAYLLLISDEEDAFWLVLSCASELKAFNLASILKCFIQNHCPDADTILKSNDIEISLISSQWFSTLFATYIPDTEVLFRFWDLYFYYGAIVLFQLTVGMILHTTPLLTSKDLDSAEIFNTLSDLPLNITNAKRMLKRWSKGQEVVHHIKLPTNLGKTFPAGAPLTRSTSLLSLPVFSTDSAIDSPDQEIRSKNIRHTNMLNELHEAIVSIGKHFEAYDSNYRAVLVPDFTDLNNDFDEYDSVRPRKSFRRAKALIDFQRHDADELGFRKNDIITVISERDEHCWVSANSL